jgi:hypothetical protein
VSGRHAAFEVTAEATRIDFEFIPGDPVDVLVPIHDDNDVPVPIGDGAVGAWSARATVRRSWVATGVLHQWSTTAGNAVIVPGSRGAVRLVASGEETAAWQQAWPELDAHFDLEVTPPGAGSQTIAAGRIRLRPQYTS